MKNFIRRIDQDWLLNNPTLWATRIHYFLYAYTFMVAVAYLIGLTFPMSTQNLPSVEGHFAFALILSGIAFLVWAYKASLFQVTKQFGNTNIFTQLKTQGIYLLITCMLGIVPFLYSLTLAQREARLVSNKELIYDCNVLNVGNYYLTVRRGMDMALRAEEDANLTTSEITDAAMTTSNYSDYTADFYLSGGMGEWTSEEVVAHIGKNKAEQMAQIEAFLVTLVKYGSTSEMTANEIYESFQRGETQYLNDMYEVKDVLRKISQAKTGELFVQQTEFQQFSGFFAFCLALTFFTFAATSLQTFVISVITGIVGSILVTLLGAFSAYIFDIGGSNEETFFSFAYLCLIGLLVAFGVFANTKPRVVVARQVALTIATVLTPTIPLVSMILIGTRLNKYNYEQTDSLFMFEILVYTLFAVSTIGSWFVWNILYRPQLLKIQTIPVKN